MTFKIQVLASLNVILRLNMNNAINVASRKIISLIVRLVTRGLVIKIAKVAITSNEIPLVKLEKAQLNPERLLNSKRNNTQGQKLNG